jgi:transposase
MRAYSVDLRQKLVITYQAEKISQRQLAQRFGVAKSFVQKILKQYKETGDVAPKPYSESSQLKLTSENQVFFVEIVDQNNDATLDELCVLLEERTGVKLSRATMCNMMKRLRLTRKKLYTL